MHIQAQRSKLIVGISSVEAGAHPQDSAAVFHRLIPDQRASGENFSIWKLKRWEACVDSCHSLTFSNNWSRAMEGLSLHCDQQAIHLTRDMLRQALGLKTVAEHWTWTNPGSACMHASRLRSARSLIIVTKPRHLFVTV